MKSQKPKTTADLRSEYRFDYSKAKPNRFASSAQSSSVAVLLEPDVAEVFTDSKSVNSMLRALLKAMPARQPRGTSRPAK